jgi:hypothetical protein
VVDRGLENVSEECSKLADAREGRHYMHGGIERNVVASLVGDRPIIVAFLYKANSRWSF